MRVCLLLTLPDFIRIQAQGLLVSIRARLRDSRYSHISLPRSRSFLKLLQFDVRRNHEID